tara:strand:- start:317 stop:436 length:120 start_codon:yes stop_codon:yes gene_type:complete
MFLDYLRYVFGAAVANFYSVTVKYLVQFVGGREMFINEL